MVFLKLPLSLLATALLAVPAPLTRPARPQASPSLLMRVVDTGPGLMCVLKIPAGNDFRYIVYDAGNFTDRGKLGYKKLQEIVPLGSTIDWLILSHSDSDHLGSVGEIMDGYTVQKVVRPTIARDSSTWREADLAIKAAVASRKTTQYVAGAPEVKPGTKFKEGDGQLNFICGFNEPPTSWGLVKNSAEWLNAGSILVRFVYGGRSILLTGDAVGRHIDDPDSACIATEKFAVDQAAQVPIRSYVLVAPHHGADNGSSPAFIRAVHPTYVVFSAGHKFGHPRKSAALRYLAAGVDVKKMFRTDRGDDEGSKEWDQGRIAGTVDPAGDDDVDVVISKSGKVAVGYRDP